MQSSEYLINILGVGCAIIIMSLAIALSYKIEKLKSLLASVNNLKRALDEMDEQAKLILRTDMELNKTQEELDKKITGLYALQRLSRAISTTLEENQIFKMIESSYLEDLGFEKACGYLWDEKENKFALQLNIAYSQNEIKTIQTNIDSNKSLYLGLIEKEKTISSISIQDALLKNKINTIFKTSYFVTSPILPKEGNKGFLFVGTDNVDMSVTEGDEELITILSNQIGQALENARLFEKTWRAQHDLEEKVEARTHELRLALDEVKKVSQRKTDFVSSVSHELRTPLTSIKGYASILVTGKLGLIPEEARQRIDKINRHCDELVHLVNDLLDIARIESGRMTMKQDSQDLKNIVAGVLDLLSVQLKEKQIESSFNISPDAPVVFVDFSQIQRVFINLINNALKFTPQKGKITISSKKIDKEVQIDVVDSGCGILKEAQERIFEEFYRVDNLINQQTKGTGLGLSLVKNIVEAHGGKVWVKSTVGEGTTFSLTLPTQP
jgi:signal transduction histidine kinase